MNFDTFLSKIQAFFTDRALPAVFILLAGYFLQRIASASADFALRKALSGEKLSHFNRENRLTTLGNILRNAVAITIIVLAATIALDKIGVNISPIIAGAGIVGLAVGFGAQTLVRDVVTGFFILAENQFNVGDTIQVAGVKGLVREMKIRTTTIIDEQGNLNVIPNSLITTVTKFPKS